MPRWVCACFGAAASAGTSFLLRGCSGARWASVRPPGSVGLAQELKVSSVECSCCAAKGGASKREEANETCQTCQTVRRNCTRQQLSSDSATAAFNGDRRLPPSPPSSKPVPASSSTPGVLRSSACTAAPATVLAPGARATPLANVYGKLDSQRALNHVDHSNSASLRRELAPGHGVVDIIKKCRRPASATVHTWLTLLVHNTFTFAANGSEADGAWAADLVTRLLTSSPLHNLPISAAYTASTSSLRGTGCSVQRWSGTWSSLLRLMLPPYMLVMTTAGQVPFSVMLRPMRVEGGWTYIISLLSYRSLAYRQQNVASEREVALLQR